MEPISHHGQNLAVPSTAARPTPPHPAGDGHTLQRPEPEEDRVELSANHAPKVVYVVLDERVERVGDQEHIRETVEERVEEDGKTLHATVSTLTTQLRDLPQQALAAQAHLDPTRVGQLIGDTP